MQKFNQSFYTDDFDQETLDWLITEGYAVWDNHGNTPSLDELYLRCASATAFWTTSNQPTSDFGEYLTKNQFKDKIGMTNESQPDKQERIFKLIDKDGYFAKSNANKEFLEDYGVVVDGFYYYKGLVDEDGDLMETTSDWCLIEQTEFQHFEEVDRIPLPKDKPKIEEVCSTKTSTFTKSMLKSGEHIVETREGERFIVAGEYLLGENDYDHVESLADTLEDVNQNKECDIVKVYSGKVYKEINIVAGKGVLDYINSNSLTLIWERESPEQKEKRLQKEKLELKLQELQKECRLVEDEIMKLGEE